MEGPTRSETLTIKLIYLFIFVFSPVLVFCHAAFPANLRVVREDGIEYRAADSVAEDAFKRAQFVVRQMTWASPKILEKMAAAGFRIEIIGQDQVLTDLPDYVDLKGKKTRDGRDFDAGTRGVGSRKMCSVGEENLLCLRHQRYWQEDVFVHEFSHSMMQYLDEDDLRNLEAAYQNAVEKELYPIEIYMVSTSGEYWAEGVQVWLGVTLRTDANGGFNTQQKIRDHDERLAAVLEKVYGSRQLQHSPGCAY
jgi:hypothetical protein